MSSFCVYIFFFAGFKSHAKTRKQSWRFTPGNEGRETGGKGEGGGGRKNIVRDCADCECIAAVDELGAKGSACYQRVLPLFPRPLFLRRLRCFNRVAMAEGGRSRFMKEKLRGNVDIDRSIGRGWTYGTTSGSNAELFIGRLSMDDKDIIWDRNGLLKGAYPVESSKDEYIF